MQQRAKETWSWAKKKVYGNPAPSPERLIPEPQPTSIAKIVSHVGTDTLKFGINTLKYGFNQFGTSIKVLETLLFNEHIQPTCLSVAENVLHLAPELAYLAALEYFKDNPNLDSLNSLMYVMEWGLCLWATRTWLTTKAVSLFAGVDFLRIQSEYKPLKSICVKECASLPKFLNGFMQENIAFYANLGLVFGVSFIPYIGPQLSYLLSIVVMGRYIAGITTTRCGEHHTFQLEATIIIGLGFEFWKHLIHSALETIMTLPSGMTLKIIDNIPLLLQIAYTRLSTSPVILKSDRTFPFDPLEMWESLCWFSVKALAVGINYCRPTGTKPLIPWETIQAFLYHEKTAKIQAFLLPKMFRSWEDFLTHDVVKPNWLRVQETLVKVLYGIEKWSIRTEVKLAQFSPKSSGWLLFKAFGFPPLLIEALLSLMSDDDLMEVVHLMRRWVDMHGEKIDRGLINAPPITDISYIAPAKAFEENKIQALNTPSKEEAPSLPASKSRKPSELFENKPRVKDVSLFRPVRMNTVDPNIFNYKNTG